MITIPPVLVLVFVLVFVFVLVLVLVLVFVVVDVEVLFCITIIFLIHNPFVAKENPWLHDKHELGPKFIQFGSKNVHNLDVDTIL